MIKECAISSLLLLTERVTKQKISFTETCSLVKDHRCQIRYNMSVLCLSLQYQIVQYQFIIKYILEI